MAEPGIHQVTVRPATREDLPALHAIAARAATELLAGTHFTHAEVTAFHEVGFYKIEPEVVDAGTYYAAELDGVLVGGSGWGASGRLSPVDDGQATQAGTAAMRQSYVEPRWAGQGIGKLLARTTEAAAIISGFRRFEAMCSPMSAGLRRSLGYERVGYVHVPVTGGVSVRLARMAKELALPTY